MPKLEKPSAGFGPLKRPPDWSRLANGRLRLGIGNPCKLAGNLNQDSLETLQVGTAHFFPNCILKVIELMNFITSLYIASKIDTFPILKEHLKFVKRPKPWPETHRPNWHRPLNDAAPSTVAPGRHNATCASRESPSAIGRPQGISRLWRHFPWNCQQKWKVLSIGLLNDDLYLKFCYYQYYCLINFIIVTLILSSIVYLAWSRMSIPWPKKPWRTWALKQRLTKPYPTHNISNKK